MSIQLRIGAVRGNTSGADHLTTGHDAASSDTDAHDIPIPDEVYHRPQTYPGCFGLPYQNGSDFSLCFASCPLLALSSQVFWDMDLATVLEPRWQLCPFFLTHMKKFCQLAHEFDGLLSLPHPIFTPLEPITLCIFGCLMEGLLRVLYGTEDHNYGAPPPLSPPPKSPPTPVPKVNGSVELEEEAKVPAVSNEEEVVEDSITRCICGFLHDDGYMICCDKCSVWQHIDCMEIDRNNIPENYCCEICEPRKLDFDRAKMIQLRKREEIDTSATDTDPEEPANALASLGRRPVQPKPKGSKQRRVSKAGARLLKTGRLAKSQQLKREKKLKLTKKEKENMKDACKKQKVGKAGLPKQKKLKKKLNTSLTQNDADCWSSVSSSFCNVEETKENDYSPEILEFLSHAKTNGIHSPLSIGIFPEELLVRLYQVSDVRKNLKGLEATGLIAPGRAVIEFKGKVMLRQHYQQDPLLNQSQPYVLYYSKFEGLDLCIDASAFGGDARFIRRSCTPNAEMCHIVDNGNLHFIVQAKKEIAKGSEITIPFDFSYQDSSTAVECACGRVNCPVAKFSKKLKLKLAGKSPEKPKRKRQASGEGRVRRSSQSKNSPIKALSGSKSPVKNSPLKSPAAVMPLSFSLDEPTISVDTSHVDSLPTVPAVVKPAPIPRRSSRAISDNKEEKDVKPSRTSSQSKEPLCKTAAVQEDIQVVDVQSSATESAAQPVSESEADSAGECPKKMTREERKMEAIMKAFEKMAKREERRKEALARLDKKHVDIKEEPVDRSHPAESSLGSSSESGAEKVPEQLPQPMACIQSPETEQKVVVKLEDPPPIVDSPQKSVRHKRVKRKRRSSRVMSAVEPLYSSPPQPRLQMPSTADVLHSGGEEMKEEPCDQFQATSHSAPNTASPDLDSFDPDVSASYTFHKKKKHLFNEWSGSRNTEGRADLLDEHMREEEMFVTYTPGPRNAMEHIQRRNSTSASFGRASDSASGNAKKRWLRQAMYERVPLRVETITSSPQPVPPGSTSPAHNSISAAAALATPSLPSPTGSPPDFVTPLKKRRLAPEFLPSMSSAAHPISSCSSEPTRLTASPAGSEVTATTPAISTPTAADESKLLSKNASRLPKKATCMFDRRNRNGFVGSTDSKTSSCDDPWPESCASPPRTDVVASDGRQDELSVDGLSSSTSLQPVQFASASSLASTTVGNSADSAEASGCSSDSQGMLASSSTVVCVVNSRDSATEVPLVDSSGTALDGDITGMTQGGERDSDSVEVCSSDNEVSVQCVHSLDNDHRVERGSRQDVEMVAESSSLSPASGLHHPQDQDEVISESQSVEDRMEVEDEGNEASGSVSGSEELGTRSESLCGTRLQPAGDCQVNSSQDCPWTGSLAAVSCSPGQGEAECNTSSQPLTAQDRTCDSRQISADDSEKASVSSAIDNNLGERSGVSSAQDIGAVSSLIFVRDSESLASSDMECGPSSSTQALHSRQDESTEDMVCNSSDISGSDIIPSVFEENNVDSTTQSGRVLRSTQNQCDTASSHLLTAESEESCCDSNSDKQALSALSSEGASVSSSGPADSQCNEVGDSGQGSVSASRCVVSSSASVSSSLFNSNHIDSALGMPVSSMLATTTSSSGLSTTEAADLPDPSQSTSSTSPSISNSSPGMDSASVDVCVSLVTSAVAASGLDSREFDGVGTSEQSSGSCTVAEQCEASTSSSHSWRMSDDGDFSLRPMSSGSPQNQECGELPVSSMTAGLDSHCDRMVVNGDVVNGGLVSSINEDSSGSNSANSLCAAVSSSEAQAAPSAKRKVSLSEYRNRRKDKTGSLSSASSTSPKSSSESQIACRRATLDGSISLTPLPLFEPITINREHRDLKEQEKEKREKPMSLSDRLRIEFGLETTSEEEEKSNSTGLKKSSKDIPPPPPLPPNGVLGGVGVRRPINTGHRAGSTENEDDGQQASTSSFAGKSPSATATTSGMGVVYSSASNSLNHSLGCQPAHSQASLQPGYTWLAKLHSARPASAGAGVAGPSLHHQYPSSSSLFGTGMTQQQQRPHSPFNGLGVGGVSHLLNGSHPQTSAAFSTGVVYPAPQGQNQGSLKSFPATTKQQQAPPPPPPPTTAYSPYVAQSRTHSVHPQTSPLGPGQQAPRGRSGSLSQTQCPASTASAVGNGAGRMRHSSADPSSSHLQGRYHYEQFSHNQTVKQKGFHGPDRSRH